MPIETPEQNASKRIDRQLNDVGWDIVPRDEYVPKSAPAFKEVLYEFARVEAATFRQNRQVRCLATSREARSAWLPSSG